MIFLACLALFVGLGIIGIVMETVKQMHRHTLAHRERMKELEVEALRLQAGLESGYGDPNYLPSPSGTLVRRGPGER